MRELRKLFMLPCLKIQGKCRKRKRESEREREASGTCRWEDLFLIRAIIGQRLIKFPSRKC